MVSCAWPDFESDGVARAVQPVVGTPNHLAARPTHAGAFRHRVGVFEIGHWRVRYCALTDMNKVRSERACTTEFVLGMANGQCAWMGRPGSAHEPPSVVGERWDRVATRRALRSSGMSGPVGHSVDIRPLELPQSRSHPSSYQPYHMYMSPARFRPGTLEHI